MHQKIDNDSEKALIFNQIFSSVFVKTQPIHSNEANFASQVESIASSDILVPFDDSDFSLTEVYTILIKLDTSKAPDIDGFPTIMIRQIAHEIAEPLTYIFKLSLAHGLCPSGWKNVLVKPLHKSGSKSDFRNLSANFNNVYFLPSDGKIDCFTRSKVFWRKSSLESCSAGFSKK